VAAAIKLARNRERIADETNLSASEGKYAAMEERAPAGRQAKALALAGLKARIGLVDDVNAALAPNNLVVAVAAAQGFQ
jgi:hypothetical protein